MAGAADSWLRWWQKIRIHCEENDECDHVFGSGWVKIKDKDVLEGEFRFPSRRQFYLLSKESKVVKSSFW